MQSYTVIIGVLEMREKHFSYRDIRSRYGIGQGTAKLILDRANELGLPLADIRHMEPEKVETAFYPPENTDNAPLVRASYTAGEGKGLRLSEMCSL